MSAPSPSWLRRHRLAVGISAVAVAAAGFGLVKAVERIHSAAAKSKDL